MIRLGCNVLPKLSVIRWLGRLDLRYEKIKPTWLYRRGLARKITFLGSYKDLHQMPMSPSKQSGVAWQEQSACLQLKTNDEGRPFTVDKEM